MVATHVNKLGGATDTAVCGLDHSLGLSDKGDYCTIGGLSRIYIEELHIAGGGDCRSYRIDYRFVAALAEVGHTFDKTFVHGVLSFKRCFFL